MAIFSSKKFDFDKHTNTFSATRSTLTPLGSRSEVFHQIFQDSCDEGLTIISTVTGVTIDYYVQLEQYHPVYKSEIQSWQLMPTEDSIRKHPRASGTKVIIFND